MLKRLYTFPINIYFKYSLFSNLEFTRLFIIRIKRISIVYMKKTKYYEIIVYYSYNNLFSNLNLTLFQ